MIAAVDVMPDPPLLPTVRLDGAPSDAGTQWAAKLVESQGPVVLRLLWKLLGREADVLDAYQDTFCRLALLPIRPDLRSAKAYVIRTASNIAIEMIRSRKRRQAHWPEVAARYSATCDGESAADDGESSRLDELRRCVAELPPYLRNIITLRDLGRLSYEEVGRTLGIDPATARVYRRHAVVRLATLMDGSGAGETPGATSGGKVKGHGQE